ncbi:hypothetical protein BH09BAC5_BH09BAC5_04140 [soil metagenome]
MKRIFRISGLIVWLALPFLLLFLPVDYFDKGEVFCPSKRFLNRDCPGCGLTRATQHVLHFDFSGAWHFNKLIIIIFPICVMVYLHIFGKLIGRKYFSFLEKFY